MRTEQEKDRDVKQLDYEIRELADEITELQLRMLDLEDKRSILIHEYEDF